ncbi:hypothetical protein ACQPW3_13325 [Actinosynnema sp. CA-248983]
MYATLAEDLYRQLDATERVLHEGDEKALLALAQSEGLPLVAALRALLGQHQPDANGRCATCRGRRFWLPSYWRGPESPCRALIAARLALDGATGAEHPGRHRSRLTTA